MSENHKNNKYYLPTILLGVIVAGIFLMAIFTYQVDETERALVLTFGKPTAVSEPGLHFRWPLPVQEIVKYDIRKRKFDGKSGKMEETGTRDKRQVVVGICVFYRIAELPQFKKANGLEAVEDYLSNQMNNAKKSVVGRYDYDQMINADPAKMRLDAMKKEILEQLHDNLMATCGIDVFQVDFTSIGVPEKTADAIAETMRQQRVTLAAQESEQGKAKAKKIRIEADQAKQRKITEAEAQAKLLIAEGDAKAAASYEIFSTNPELASFLKKLDALKKLLGDKTTLILHTGNVPFDVFNNTFSDFANQRTDLETVEDVPESIEETPEPEKKPAAPANQKK